MPSAASLPPACLSNRFLNWCCESGLVQSDGLTPPRTLAQSPKIDMCGLHLWRLEGRTAVHSVDKRSPAEAAGIRPEDVVLKVGETSATEMDIYDLRDLLKSGDGKEIRMTIKRGEEEKAVTFKLKKQIQPGVPEGSARHCGDLGAEHAGGKPGASQELARHSEGHPEGIRRVSEGYPKGI